MNKYSFLFLVVSILSIPLLILTSARAAYLALFISILYILFIRFLYLKRTKIICLLIGLIVIFSSIIALYIIKPQSANGRLLVWKVGWSMIKDKPLMGFGAGGFTGNYMYYQAKYMRSDASSNEKWLAGNTHLAYNEPLRIAVEHGIIGILFYLSFVVWVLLPPRNKNGISVITKSILVGGVVWSLFSYPNQVFPIIVFWVIALACYLNRSKTKGTIKFKSWYLQAFIIIMYISSSIYLGSSILVKWNTYTEFYSFLQNNNSHEIVEKMDALKKIKAEMSDNISFLYFYCNITLKARAEKDFFQTVSVLEKKFPSTELFLMKGEYLENIEQWTKAEKAYRLAAEMEPSKQTARGLLAILYRKMGRNSEAILLVREILTEKVKVFGFGTFELHHKLNKIFEDELK